MKPSCISKHDKKISIYNLMSLIKIVKVSHEGSRPAGGWDCGSGASKKQLNSTAMN